MPGAITHIGSLGTTAVVLALALAACSAPASSTTGSPSAAPSAITEAQAIAAVQAFVPEASGLHVLDTETFPRGPAYVIESADVHAIVDQGAGTVISVMVTTAMPTAATVALKPEDALASAAAYLAKHGVDVSGLTPTVTLLDHGDTQEYQVVYLAVVNGVRLPTRVDLSVNPTSGEVYGFGQYRTPIGPIPSPKLTLDDAIAAARVEEKDPGLKVTSSDLAVTVDTAGAQRLVYELRATKSSGFYVWLNIDALSGAVTVMGRG